MRIPNNINDDLADVNNYIPLKWAMWESIRYCSWASLKCVTWESSLLVNRKCTQISLTFLNSKLRCKSVQIC